MGPEELPEGAGESSTPEAERLHAPASKPPGRAALPFMLTQELPSLTLAPSCDHLNDMGLALQESWPVKGVCLSQSWRGLAWFASVWGDAGWLPFSLLPAPPSRDGEKQWGVVNLYLNSSHKKHGCRVHLFQKTQEIRNLTYFSK